MKLIESYLRSSKTNERQEGLSLLSIKRKKSVELLDKVKVIYIWSNQKTYGCSDLNCILGLLQVIFGNVCKW